MVEFVFSDKTGTLTENSLDFRKAVIGSRSFGTGTTEIGRAALRRQKNHKMPLKEEIVQEWVAPHVYFDQKKQLQRFMRKRKEGSQEEKTLMYLRCLALNNTCFPVWEQVYDVHYEEEDKFELTVEERNNGQKVIIVKDDDLFGLEHVKSNSVILAIDGKSVMDLTVGQLNDKLAQIAVGPVHLQLRRSLSNPEFKASSPDDEALVNFAHFIGVSLIARRPPEVTLRVTYRDEKGNEKHEIEVWEELALLDFASHKKANVRNFK
eukprot:UN23380